MEKSSSGMKSNTHGWTTNCQAVNCPSMGIGSSCGPDALPDANQLRIKEHWNLEASSAVAEFPPP